MRIAQGVLRYAREKADWNVRICGEIERYAIRAFRPDAVICVGYREARIRRFVPETRHWVGVMPPARSKAPLQIAIDDEEIGRLAAEHLIGQGLRHFAFYGLDVEWSHRRLAGFRHVLEQHGFEAATMVSATSEHAIRGWPPGDPPERIGQWLRGLQTPCGLFCCHDPIGVLISGVCEDMGIGIPDQVAIVSADDDPLMCESATVSLTSVDPDWDALGLEAASLLHEAMCGGNGLAARRVVRPKGVMVRSSTDALAACDPVVQQAVRYLRSHACENISVGDLEDHMGMSRRTLELRFRNALGRTPWEELRQFRMQKAAELLRTTDLKLSVIARRCGFEYVTYFSRVFLQVHGVSPAQYRKRHAAGEFFR